MKRITFLKRKNKLLRKDHRLKCDGFRVYFFKSNKHFYASVIDNSNGNVLYSLSSKLLSDVSKSTKEKVLNLALKFSSGFDFTKLGSVNFDRGVYKYHGLVKLFVEEIRKNGVKV